MSVRNIIVDVRKKNMQIKKAPDTLNRIGGSFLYTVYSINAG